MESSKKILLVHFYSNGDCLYATAIARQIKEDFPDCHLTWVIASNCKSIIDNNPYVDKIIVVKYIPRNDPAEFEELYKQISFKEFDHVFITHPSYLKNLALYDGCIRSNVLNAYPKQITVPITPVLNLTDQEINKCKAFVEQHALEKYRHVILFEFAPQSGQLNITKDAAVAIAEEVVKMGDTAIILSSANKIEHLNKAIIDGSSLTLRETAGLTHDCTLLLGCSSGITWITTSSAAKLLPMVQILNPEALWVNPISRDFERFNLPVEKVIELFHFDQTKIVSCVKEAMNDFGKARQQYHQKVPLHFRTSRKIVYELICRLKLYAIIRHIQVNRKVYGDNSAFYKEVLMGVVLAPITFLQNTYRKRILHKNV